MSWRVHSNQIIAMGSYSVTAHEGQWLKTISHKPTPQVCSSSVVLVGVQKTTPPPVSTLCALSEPPATLVSFITGSDGSVSTSGVPPLQEQGLSAVKVSDVGWKLSVFRPYHCQYISNLRNCEINWLPQKCEEQRFRKGCFGWVYL